VSQYAFPLVMGIIKNKTLKKSEKQKVQDKLK
jgi:hypothetical protein